jgi:lipopolysaccharide/colanic/teichoic acid biosynthesis glycosyltransferase
MSLVGPRPERPEFVRQFGENIERYSDRHRVKSGITAGPRSTDSGDRPR